VLTILLVNELVWFFGLKVGDFATLIRWCNWFFPVRMDIVALTGVSRKMWMQDGSRDTGS
jgi:hypothetical protein